MSNNISIILLQDVPDLGHKGDNVRVKRGYFYNFLLPKTLAAHQGSAQAQGILLEIKKRKIEKTKQIEFKKEKKLTQEKKHQAMKEKKAKLLRKKIKK